MWQGMAHTYSTSAINSLLSMKTVAEIASELTFFQINGQTTLKMDPPDTRVFYVATSATKSASEGGKFSCRTSDQRHWYGSLRRLYPIDERLQHDKCADTNERNDFLIGRKYSNFIELWFLVRIFSYWIWNAVNRRGRKQIFLIGCKCTMKVRM